MKKITFCPYSDIGGRPRRLCRRRCSLKCLRFRSGVQTARLS